MMLVLLQNAWSPCYAGRVWPREWWLDALWACPTGRKLSMYILKGIPEEEYWVDNTTPICGKLSSSVVKPDFAHVKKVLGDQSITFVVACGKQANAVANKVWRGPCVEIPHPACRWVGREIMMRCNLQILEMWGTANRFRRTGSNYVINTNEGEQHARFSQ